MAGQVGIERQVNAFAHFNYIAAPDNWTPFKALFTFYWQDSCWNKKLSLTNGNIHAVNSCLLALFWHGPFGQRILLEQFSSSALK